jgi:hypothetical protein
LFALGLGRLAMGAKGFVRLAYRKLLDRGGGAVECKQLEGAAVLSVAEDRFPRYGKHPFHEVILAFGESESASTSP